jgi:hypothetical protein
MRANSVWSANMAKKTSEANAATIKDFVGRNYTASITADNRLIITRSEAREMEDVSEGAASILFALQDNADRGALDRLLGDLFESDFAFEIDPKATPATEQVAATIASLVASEKAFAP